MRGQPGSAEHDRRPPGIGEEHHGTGEPGHHLHQTAGDEVDGDVQRRAGHAPVELARHGQIGCELRVLEVADARLTHAGVGQPVVEPGGSSVAEIGAHRLVNGREHLEQDEHGADEGERAGERVAVLHRADEHTHCDGEHGRQRAAQYENGPPDESEKAIGFRQNAEELPLAAFTQTLPDHQSCATRRGGATSLQPPACSC